jgi:hypothetical protein
MIEIYIYLRRSVRIDWYRKALSGALKMRILDGRVCQGKNRRFSAGSPRSTVSGQVSTLGIRFDNHV